MLIQLLGLSDGATDEEIQTAFDEQTEEASGEPANEAPDSEPASSAAPAPEPVAPSAVQYKSRSMKVLKKGGGM